MRKTNPMSHNYKIFDVIIKHESEVKDLGVFFQLNLKFNDYFYHMKNKATKALGFLISNTKKN